MEITELINHPEQMDRDTLYELRSMLALYPYFQTVRILMLQNLYLLHDPTFDEELRRSAVYITDRKTLFNLVEAAHYQLRQQPSPNTHQRLRVGATAGIPSPNSDSSRTMSLIDTFLDSIPAETTEEEKKKRRPTPADATVDYVAYLMESEMTSGLLQGGPQMQGQDLIDHFLEEEEGRILLRDLSDEEEPVETPVVEEESNDEEYFTETLARIYIKQGRYQKALDIIQRLSSNFPEKNAYFADQIRFLEKLIINTKNKTTK